MVLPRKFISISHLHPRLATSTAPDEKPISWFPGESKAVPPEDAADIALRVFIRRCVASVRFLADFMLGDVGRMILLFRCLDSPCRSVVATLSEVYH